MVSEIVNEILGVVNYYLVLINFTNWKRELAIILIVATMKLVYTNI